MSWPTSCRDCGAEWNIDYKKAAGDVEYCPFCGSDEVEK